jgi:hypothetical protein
MKLNDLLLHDLQSAAKFMPALKRRANGEIDWDASDIGPEALTSFANKMEEQEEKHQELLSDAMTDQALYTPDATKYTYEVIMAIQAMEQCIGPHFATLHSPACDCSKRLAAAEDDYWNARDTYIAHARLNLTL